MVWKHDAGRYRAVLSFNAVLELDQDVAPPDNFTLALNIVEDNYNRRVATEPGNYSTNEPARAEMAEDGMNERRRWDVHPIQLKRCFAFS